MTVFTVRSFSKSTFLRHPDFIFVAEYSRVGFGDASAASFDQGVELLIALLHVAKHLRHFAAAVKCVCSSSTNTLTLSATKTVAAATTSVNVLVRMKEIESESVCMGRNEKSV